MEGNSSEFKKKKSADAQLHGKGKWERSDNKTESQGFSGAEEPSYKSFGCLNDSLGVVKGKGVVLWAWRVKKCPWSSVRWVWWPEGCQTNRWSSVSKWVSNLFRSTLVNSRTKRALDSLRLRPWFWAFIPRSTKLMKLTELPDLVESCWLALVTGTPHLCLNVLLYSCFVLNLNDDLHLLHLRLQLQREAALKRCLLMRL